MKNIIREIRHILFFFLAALLAVVPGLLNAQDKASKSSKSPSSSTSGSGSTDKSNKSTKSKSSSSKLDLNTASTAELTKLPGITSDIARKIVAARPFANKAQLKSRDILTEDQYDKITDLVIAKQHDDSSTSAPKSDSTTKSKSKSKAKSAD